MPGWAKALILTCGGLVFAGLLLVAGCAAFIAYAVKRGSDYAEAWREMARKTEVDLRASRPVRDRVGDIVKVENHDRPRGEHPAAGSLVLYVTGTKGEGRAVTTYDVANFQPIVRRRVFVFAEERIDLETGAPSREAGE